MAAQRIAAKHPTARVIPVAPAAPSVIVDVGGVTTDFLYCAEDAAVSPGQSILRQVFTDLGSTRRRCMACLFLALRRLSESGPHAVNLSRRADGGHPPGDHRRLWDAGCPGWSLILDRPYLLSAHGLLSVPNEAQVGS